jgi:transposase
MHCTTLGIAAAKNVFHLHGVDEREHVVMQNRVSRGRFRATNAQLPACVIGMEACSSAQLLGAGQV